MSKSIIFKKAHKIAKAIAAKVGDYMIAMSIALKEVYASMKKSLVEQIKELSGKKMTKLTEAQIIAEYEAIKAGSAGVLHFDYTGPRFIEVLAKDADKFLNVETKVAFRKLGGTASPRRPQSIKPVYGYEVFVCTPTSAGKVFEKDGVELVRLYDANAKMVVVEY